MPTLILWGENDEFAPVAGAHRFLDEIPGAELQTISGAGHFLYSDAPAASASRSPTSSLSATRPGQAGVEPSASTRF